MKLGLGTVQFGLDYGVSNTQGMTPLGTVKEILELAHKAGITALDTATLYGKSEEVLGAALSHAHGFNIITKTPQYKKIAINQTDALKLRESFEASLSKLGKQSIYGLLVHHADDLLAKDGERLMDVMLELKALGKVKKIGVSIYNANQIDHIIERYSIDLVQLPINVFDQRLLANGSLKALKKAGVEIHARSIFLQGLLLMPLEQIPDYFSPIKPVLSAYHDFLIRHDMTPLQGALSFASASEYIDSAILGVASVKDLNEILDAWQGVPKEVLDFSDYASNDERMINPAQWKLS